VYSALINEKEIPGGRFARNLPTSPGPNNTRHAMCALERYLKARLLDRLIGGRCCQPGKAVGEQDRLIALPVFEACPVIEILDLAGDLSLEIIELHAFNRTDSGSALFQAVPKIGNRLTDRRYDSHTGNDHTGAKVRVSHSVDFRF
jgi:hypothetical protein